MADALYTAANNMSSHAPTASASLATISAGSDVLVSNFAGLQSLVDDLTSLASAFKDKGFYTPVGSVLSFAGASAPVGWLLCNGDAVPNGSGTVQGVTTNFADLYSVLGGAYGTSGANRLLPNLRDRVPLSVGSTYSLGASGGAATAALSVNNLPAHTHTATSTVTDPGHGHTNRASTVAGVNNSNDGFVRGTNIQDGGFGNTNANTTGITVSTSVSGGGNGTATGNSFSTISPYVVVNFIIKY